MSGALCRHRSPEPDGVIYVCRRLHGLYKIGFTNERVPQRRIRRLAVDFGGTFEPLRLIESYESKAVEREILRALAPRRANRQRSGPQELFWLKQKTLRLLLEAPDLCCVDSEETQELLTRLRESVS